MDFMRDSIRPLFIRFNIDLGIIGTSVPYRHPMSYRPYPTLFNDSVMYRQT